MQKMILVGTAAVPLALACTIAIAIPIGSEALAAFPAKPVVVARDAHGRATEVRISGQDYPVCSSKQRDECINPRQAGLNFGNRPLAHWIGWHGSETKG